MAAEIPTKEPASAIAGDTWSWTKSLSDYPAPTWTLTYYFRSREGEFNFNAAADGADHLVTVTAATTAGYKAGRYGWTVVVTSGSERRTVETGELEVLPDPASTGAGQDPRSHARKVLDAIQAVLEGRATKDQEEYSIGSRSLKRTPLKDLQALEASYQARVTAEEAKQGKFSTGRLSVRL